MGATDPFLTAVLCADARIARTGRLSGARLQRAVEYMHAHLSERICVEDLAAAANLSAFHFARLFKRTTGLTPHRFLTRARVEKAGQLLSTRERMLSEIASECGFSDQSHMSRAFRRWTGMTPRAFREAATAVPGQPRLPAIGCRTAAVLDAARAQASKALAER
jgi:AraC-like DNA-binding protein